MSDSARLLERALAGDRDALGELVAELAPVIHTRATGALWKRGGGKSPSSHDVGDLVQEVFVALFADDARVLRQWQEARGLSLKNFAALVAQRLVATIFRNGRRDAWRDELREPARLDRETSEAFCDRHVVSRQLLEKLWCSFQESLSPLARELFWRLYVEEQSVRRVQQDCGLSADAVYQWRRRLKKIAQDTLDQLESTSARPRRKPCRESLNDAGTSAVGGAGRAREAARAPRASAQALATGRHRSARPACSPRVRSERAEAK